MHTKINIKISNKDRSTLFRYSVATCELVAATLDSLSTDPFSLSTEARERILLLSSYHFNYQKFKVMNQLYLCGFGFAFITY